MALLTLFAAAQLLTVDDDGPADFGSIQEAVDAAVEGDSILVRDGIYGPFVVDGTSLSFYFEPGSVAGTLEVANLAPDQRVLVSGMTATGRAFFHDCAGNVWLEGCNIDAFAAVIVTDCDSVVIVDSLIDSDVFGIPFVPAAGLVVTASDVQAYDSSISGAIGIGGGHALFCDEGRAPGGAGARIESGSFFASGCTFTGGPGGFGDDNGLMFSGDGTDGGPGVEVFPGAEAELFACGLVAGAAGLGTPGCADGAVGEPLVDTGGGATTTAGIARSLDGPGFVSTGDTVDLVFRGAREDFVFGLASLSQLTLDVSGFLGPWQVGIPVVIVPVGLLFGGELTLSFQVGRLQPGVVALSQTLQPLMVDGSAQAYLGAPSKLTVLAD